MSLRTVLVASVLFGLAMAYVAETLHSYEREAQLLENLAGVRRTDDYEAMFF